MFFLATITDCEPEARATDMENGADASDAMRQALDDIDADHNFQVQDIVASESAAARRLRRLFFWQRSLIASQRSGREARRTERTRATRCARHSMTLMQITTFKFKTPSPARALRTDRSQRLMRSSSFKHGMLTTSTCVRAIYATWPSLC